MLFQDGCQFMTSILAPYICATCMLFFYFSFLRKEDKKLYKSMLNTIYSHYKLSDEVETRIGAHQNELKRKKLEKAGKEVKDRIA